MTSRILPPGGAVKGNVMSDTRKYEHTYGSGADLLPKAKAAAAVCERLEAIVAALDGLERGLRNMALMNGLDRVAKNPDILRELGGIFVKDKDKPDGS